MIRFFPNNLSADVYSQSWSKHGPLVAQDNLDECRQKPTKVDESANNSKHRDALYPLFERLVHGRVCHHEAFPFGMKIGMKLGSDESLRYFSLMSGNRVLIILDACQLEPPRLANCTELIMLLS
jgi:hypothetical protein